MRTFTFFLLSLSALSLSAQSDDVYYSPKHDNEAQETAPAAKHDAQNYDYDDSETYSDYNADETYSESETTTDENGNTYITNNYYGDYYESDYTTKLNRFYSPYMGFGYYSPCYSGYYYDPYYNYGYGGGWSVSVGFGFGWGYSSYGGYYDPWYYPNYNPWYSNYGHGGGYYGHGYGHGYNHGYNDGYNHGYYDGYYGNDGYYGHSGDYHYGPRYKTQGTSAYRNNTAEKKAPGYEVVEKRSDNNINTFPAGENKDVMTPVRVGNPSQLSNQPIKNDGKSVNDSRIENNPAINKGVMKPVNNNEVVKTQNPAVLDKGQVKPINNETIQKDTRNSNIDKYDVKTPGTQGGINTNPSQKPDVNVPKNEPPVNRGEPTPKPNYNQKPNTDKQVNPGYDNKYQKPQRGANYEPKQPKPSQQKPGGEINVPKNDYTPSHDASPKRHDRGGSYQKSEPRSGGYNNAPAPSNRGSMGGTYKQSAPQGARDGVAKPK